MPFSLEFWTGPIEYATVLVEWEVPTIAVFAKSAGSSSPDSGVFPAPFRHRLFPFTPAVVPITAAFADAGVDCSSSSFISRTISASYCHSNSACCVVDITSPHHIARVTSSATSQVRWTRGEVKVCRWHANPVWSCSTRTQDVSMRCAHQFVSPRSPCAVAYSANLHTNQKHRPLCQLSSDCLSLRPCVITNTASCPQKFAT